MGMRGCVRGRPLNQGTLWILQQDCHKVVDFVVLVHYRFIPLHRSPHAQRRRMLVSPAYTGLRLDDIFTVGTFRERDERVGQVHRMLDFGSAPYP